MVMFCNVNIKLLTHCLTTMQNERGAYCNRNKREKKTLQKHKTRTIFRFYKIY